MRLRHIEVFHAVYSSGSMTGAAKLLNVSQPSVSKVLAHAEQDLGYLLFKRASGKLIPTPEAHRLYGQVATVYRDIDLLRHVADNLRNPTEGTIKVAMTPSFGADLLPMAIASFGKSYPSVRFEIETLHYAEMINALTESRIEIGICFDAERTPGIAIETIATGHLKVLTSEKYDFGGKTSVELRDLEYLPFISINKKGPLGRALDKKIRASGVTVDVVAWSETYQVAKSLVAKGVGVTIADEITANSMPQNDVIICSLVPELTFDVSVVHFDDAPLSVLSQHFVGHVRDCVRSFLDQRH